MRSVLKGTDLVQFIAKIHTQRNSGRHGSLFSWRAAAGNKWPPEKESKVTHSTRIKSGLVATALVLAAASTTAFQGCASDTNTRGNRMGLRAQGNGPGLGNGAGNWDCPLGVTNAASRGNPLGYRSQRYAPGFRNPGFGAGSCFGNGPGFANGAGNWDCPVGAVNPTPVVDLSSEAREELLKMRQEEKLARDVYATLGERWGADVFAITNAEQRHMDAMERMLDRFGMEDPVTNDARGEFTDQAFTDLYNELVEAGSGSLLDAYKVGAKIEELDLFDLRVAGDGVADPVLTKVYGNLERATRNHLRMFAAQIQANNGTYSAEHLTQTEFDSIADSDFEPGGPAWRGRRGRGAGQWGGAGRGMGMGYNSAIN